MIILWVVLSALALLSAAASLFSVRNLRRTELLSRVSVEGIDEWPRVSVVMAARNEGERLAPALASRLLDDYPDLELMLVNDRSEDDTGRLAIEAAALDDRLRVVRIDALPDGWLGKVHALHQGVQRSSGEFLLFSDADVSVAPSAIRRAVAVLQRDDADCLAVLPEYLSDSAIVSAGWAIFTRTLFLIRDPKAIADPHSTHSLGSGAFTLVRKSAFDRTGGFEELRMETGDDVALADMIKCSGGACRMALGRGLVSVHSYDSLRDFLTGTEKNGSTTASRPVFFTLSMLLATAVDLAPVALLFAGPLWVRGLAGVCFLASGFACTTLLIETANLWWAGLLWPVGSLVFLLAITRATLLAVVRRGVYWRGTFYPLAELEAGRRFTI